MNRFKVQRPPKVFYKSQKQGNAKNSFLLPNTDAFYKF